MPLEDDDIIGHNHDGSFNEDYCKWCYEMCIRDRHLIFVVQVRNSLMKIRIISIFIVLSVPSFSSRQKAMHRILSR